MLLLYTLFFAGTLGSTITFSTPTVATSLAVPFPRDITAAPSSASPTPEVVYFTTTQHIKIDGTSTIDITFVTCIPTIIPDKNGYVPPGTCNALWDYYPSFLAAVIFVSLFGALTLTHIWQAFALKKAFCWTIIMGASWETTAFVFRTLSTRYQQSVGIYLVFQIFILLAPLWINAFDYMVLGRMIYYFIPTHTLFSIPAPTLAIAFVSLDFISFVIQLVGGSWAGPTSSAARQLQGIHIYMGGIGLQQFFIFVFLALAVKFQREMLEMERSGRLLVGERRYWRKPLYTVYITLGLITIRIFFRLIEFSSGTSASSGLLNHEAYFYVFDAVPMFLAILAFNFVHPGFFLIGPESELPGLMATFRAMWRKKKWEVLSDKP